MERRLLQQIEACFALLLVQGLQAHFLLVFADVGPVQVVERGAAGLMDDLQHGFTSVPAERRTQGLVACNNRLPGLGKALRVEGAVDPVAVLHVVDAGAGLKQGMQQQPFLHGRQWIHIVDLRRRHGQAVDLLLGQLRQREVRRREAAVARGQAVLDQAEQFGFVGLGQLFNGALVIALTAEGPAQLQFTGVDLAIDTQPVRQRRLRVMGLAGCFIHRLEQRIGLELLVELAEVVEGDPRLRQGRHGFAY
ncbi:hypothetical protein D9M71_457680 [compost metagenome]